MRNKGGKTLWVKQIRRFIKSEASKTWYLQFDWGNEYIMLCQITLDAFSKWLAPYYVPIDEEEMASCNLVEQTYNPY